jgi:hypothetical protein
MVEEEPGSGIESLAGRYPNCCQKSYPEMLVSKFFELSSQYFEMHGRLVH